ncbi:DUF1904 domain-containing protein [Maribrevibacterium harenarium]|uniref:DUF1904 domain-containing protein n=1 Tax=Maribrevibacterium harenarium TaxID=2589817 RepID=A0A501WFN5_9GAMM|nr:DUF1904 family protein [Maribrevibacterium harenarium]TPE48218.1 DUF1904 domain-containing protein [Maribrevibacterium harenarium]
MPHIRARGLALEELELVSDLLIEQLAVAMNTPANEFTLEYTPVTYFAVGGAAPAYPFFEILWFDRGAEVKAKVATIIDDLIRPQVEPGLDVTVLFHDLKGADYFENKQHF